MVKQTEPKGTRGKSQTAKPSRGNQSAAVDHQIKIQKALYEIADAASAVTDMQSFYRKLHEIVGKLMHAKSFYVTLYDATTGILTSPYFADEKGDEPPPPTRIDTNNKSLRAHVLLEGKTLHVSATEIEAGRRRGRFEPMGTPAEDWVGVPLKMDNQVIGSLTAQSYEKGVHYEEQDVELLEFVAQHIAVALTRARAIEETRQRNTELQVINSVQEGLASSLDIQSIYTLVGDKLREIFAADTTFIAFKDNEKNLLHVHYYADRVLRRFFSRPYRTGVAEVIIDSGAPLLLRNEAEQQQLGALHVVSPGAERDLNQSVLGVPIFRGGQACGAVTVQSYQVDAFDENDLRLLQTLTNAMSVALENARLFNETQQRNAELAIINSVQEGLASKLDMQGIYELVGEKIRAIFNAQVVSIATYDRVAQLLHSRYYFEGGSVLPGVSLPSFGFRKYVLEKCQPLVINKDMPRWIEEYDNPVVRGSEPKSAIFIPMIMGGKAVGVISLQNNDQENAFSEADVRLLTTLANSMSIALENARLFDQTQQRNAELAVINSVQEGLASKLDMQSIYNLVGDKIREVFDAQGVTIATYDPATSLLHYRYSIQQGERIDYDPMQLSNKGFRAHIVHTHQPLRLDDVELQGADYGLVKLQPANAPLTSKSDAPKSWLGVPLLVRDEVRGVVNLYNVDCTHAYSDSDVRLLETLANSMSVALENARLWEQEKLFRKALERELEIGREIQAGFLPDELPLAKGWEIAASLMSAREVAGDFYDAFELPDGNIGLVIADVCDKGVGAALFMTLFRSLIRITANREYYEHTGDISAARSIPERLQHAMLLTNNYIAQTHYDSGMFATLFFGILDPHDGKLIYINGGHEPPLILQSGEVRASLCKTGPAVGAMPDCHFDVGTAQLNPGEVLIAFTDGAPEAKDPRGEFFGRKRLLDIFQWCHDSSQQMVKAIEDDLHKYMEGATQFDDITLLAIRRAH